MALSYFGDSEPSPVKVSKIGNKKFSIWDTFLIKSPLTLGEFLEYFQETYDMEIGTVMYGNFMLIGPLTRKSEIDSRLNQGIKEIIEKALNVKLDGDITLQICPEFDDYEEIDDMQMPDVIYLK